MSFGSPPAVEFIQGRSTVERPFVPIVGTLAAEINQVPPEAFLSDATQMANGLQRAQRLFELDAVCAVPDPALIAEAFGAPVEWSDDRGRFETVERVESVDALADPDDVTNEGRVPTVVDAAERLVASTDDDVAVFGVLPGPHTTSEGLFGEPAAADDPWTKPIRTGIGEVARAFGRAGVDAFFVAESPPEDGESRDGASVVDAAVETLDVIDNIGEFFGTATGFAPGGYAAEAAEAVVDDTAVDAVFLDVDDVDTASHDFDGVRVGGGVTTALLDAGDDGIERTVRERIAGLPPDAFLASGVEVPSGVHPRKLQAVHRAAEAASY